VNDIALGSADELGPRSGDIGEERPDQVVRVGVAACS
jgi:hypothetical protein